MLLEEKIQNSEELKAFHPESLNTLRIYTMLKKDGRPTILNAFFRMGKEGSFVDNMHAGGVVAQVDSETGTVLTPAWDLNYNRYIKHPNSNKQIVGFNVPEWDNIKRLAFDMAKEIPQCRLVAWDIAITNYGLEIIEGNHNGDPTLLQMFTQKGLYKEIIKER